MAETNKDRFIQFVKVLAIFIAGFIALITNVEIWNVATDGYTDSFHVWVSILNFLMEGAGIYFFGKKVLFKKEEKKEEKEEQK